jgi:hypothetical protein
MNPGTSLYLSRVGRVLGSGVSRHFPGPWLRRRWFTFGETDRPWRAYAQVRWQRGINRWRRETLGR